ncbi:Hypothetical predicted protein [Olea europaea subsp. europaea]|uniref:DUF1985 domain-containing protein n=1 Tax=Olea europaea subsp. europaea TaxID=158383 RepID=A0A8S0TWI6_OLEEU|nr:Hypothetical predicted protein [Olea europaea subsp. europaea]
MEFYFCISEDARLRAHISQWSNLKYVKIVIDHFDDRQREDFRNSPYGYLAEVPEIQFSAQLIQQLVFRTIRTAKVNELWFNVRSNLMRFGLQKYTLVTGLRCSIFPEGDDFDRVLERKMLKESIVPTISVIFIVFVFLQHVWAYEAVPKIGGHFGQRLHVYATLRPTDAEAEQQYFSTLVPYDDPPVPVLDDIARTVVGPQFNVSHTGSGSGGQLAWQDSDDGVSSGRSTENGTSGDDDRDPQSGSDRDGNDIEDSGKGSSDRSRDSEDTRRGQMDAFSTPRTPHVSSPVRGPTMETRSVGTSRSSLTR